MRLGQARQVRQDIARLSVAGLDSTSLTAELERQLRTVVPFDRACWHNVDPATAMITSVMGESALDDPWLAVSEYADNDVNKYASLAKAVRPAATLREATEDAPERSRRYRQVLQPMGARGRAHRLVRRRLDILGLRAALPPWRTSPVRRGGGRLPGSARSAAC
jgi:hypothetical protein